MAVIQFYLGDRQFADLVDRAEVLGISSHQLAKHLMLTSEAADTDIVASMRKSLKKGKPSVRPL